MLESGRSFETFVKALAAEVKQRFRYKEVLEMPEEAKTWRAEGKRILVMTRCILDLDPDMEEHILDCDNSSWDDDEWLTHYCLPGDSCPLRCGGDAQRSLRTVTASIATSLGGKLVAPLLYRWKAFPEALAWTFRGVRQHGLLPKVLKRMWPNSVVKQAEAEVARAQTLGVELDRQRRHAIKAGSLLRFFARDTRGDKLEAATVLNEPIQEFLNYSFQAEKRATAFVDQALSSSESATASMPPETADAQLRAAQ